LHNGELHILYCSPNIDRVIQSIRMGVVGHLARMEIFRNAYTILVGKPEGKKPLGRPMRTRKWGDNIKMDHK